MELVGDFDVDEAEALDAGLRELATTGRPVEVMMDGVTFMGSAGLRALAGGRAAAVSSGGSLTVISASRTVRRLLAITGMSAPLGMHTAEEPAER